MPVLIYKIFSGQLHHEKTSDKSYIFNSKEKKRERERERERSNFFKTGFVFVNKGGWTHIIFLESSYASLHHFLLSMGSSFFSQCSICFSICHLHVIFGRLRLLLSTIPKSSPLSRHYYYLSSKYAHNIALHPPWPSSSKLSSKPKDQCFFLNQFNS